MWVRWADDARLGTDGENAKVDVAGETILIPGASEALGGLRDLLTEPKSLEALEQQLISRNVPLARDLLRCLIDAKALNEWALAPELIGLHQQTISGGESAPLSPALETRRMLREMGGGPAILLPHGDDSEVPFSHILRSRHTCRKFGARRLGLDTVGRVLSLAIAAGRDGPPSPMVPGGPAAPRPYPSGGGLYPVEVLVYPADVAEIAERFYYYQALGHRLVPYAPKLTEPLSGLLAGHPVDEAGFVVLLFADFARLSFSKYGRKTYRLALLEAGHIAQNVLLAASSLGLATLPLCGFDDEGLSRAAGLYYPEQALLYLVVAGSSAPESGGEYE